MADNVLLAELQHQYNLVFLEYKPPSNYLSIPISIPVSQEDIMMFPTIRRRKRLRARKPSVDYLRPQTDSETMWHIRAGQVGPVAL